MKKIILSLVVGVLLVPVVSFGAYWQAGDSVSITAAQPLKENAYLAGSSVNVSGGVGGDLFAAGSSVSISGKVSGDVMAAGSLVNIIDIDAQDVRAAGSSLNISGDISGELLAAGAQVVVNSDTQIGDGARIAGSALSFNGKSDGDVYLSGEKISIGSDAVIKGDLNYSSSKEASIDPAAKISGKVNFDKTKGPDANGQNVLRGIFAGLFTMFFVGKFLAMLLAAYLLWYLRKKDSVEVIQQFLSKFGASLLRGFIFLVVVPASIVVLMITMIGMPIAIFTGLLYVALLMLASPLAILTASSLIMKKKMDLQWYHILLGAAVLTLLKIVPIVGWIVVFAVYLATLGSALTVLRAKFKR